MFKNWRLKSALKAVLLLCCCVMASAAPREQAQIILKLHPQASFADRERALRNASGVHELGKALSRQSGRKQPGQTLSLSLKPEVAVPFELARLASNPGVEYVEPNYPIKIFATTNGAVIPNDFEFSKMYSLLNPGGSDSKTNADIHATAAWRYTTGDKRVVVAVIDTGIDYLHEDLRDNVWTNDREIPFNGIDDDGNGWVDDYMGYDFVSGDSDPFDDNEHGTHVAGTIGARGNNGIGTAGVCWNVSLMALKAFDDQGNGTVEDAIAAIEYAVRNGAHLINASWGLDEKSRALDEAVQSASNAGVLVVAAAGNNRSDAPSYPASFESVLSVGATDKNDARAVFSNYGATVDISAPGDSIFSTLPENRYGYLSGTSMAAPHVSGVAALVLTRYPHYTRQELFDILINSVDAVLIDQPMGNGRLDAGRAVQMDQPLPTARFSVPATLSGRIELTGTALGRYATGYRVEIGAGRTPTNWIAVASANSTVTNGPIGTLDTALVPDGPAVVRLIVSNENGSTATVNSSVKVLNALITKPLSGDIFGPGKIEILGTLYGENKQFELYYGKGLAPKTWEKLPSEPSKTILEGRLGEWDASALASGPYVLRMVSWDGTNRTEFLAPAIFINEHLHAGWPIPIGIDDDFPVAEWRNIRAADLDRDSKAELILVEPGTRLREQKLVVLSLDGTVRWSRTLGFDIPPDVPAIGDVDNDGKAEIFVDGPDGIYAFHADGSAVAGWPVKASTRNHAKVLADLNGSGTLQLITYSQEYSATQVPDLRELAAYTAQGELLRKWQLPWCGSTNDLQKIFPAVANLDEDPNLEIVALSGCSEIAAFDLRRAEPKWRATGEGAFLSSPAIGDVDGDGQLDIVVASAAQNGFELGGIYVFRADGQRWRGWPVLEEYSFTSTPALGDLNHDGHLEIVVPSTKPSGLHVVEWDGFEAEGWPVDAFHYSSSRVGVSLADVDGDGLSEVLTPLPSFPAIALGVNDPDYLGGVTARNYKGELVSFGGSTPLTALPFESFTTYRTHKSSPPVMGDFDGDGLLDMALAAIQSRTYGSNVKIKNQSSLYLWKLGSPMTGTSLDWPMFAHDTLNRGAYSLPRIIVPPPTNTTAAIRDRIIGAEDRELIIEPLLNDFGVPPLQITSVARPSHGAIEQKSENTLSYHPNKDFNGMDEFSYSMRDANGLTSSAKIFVRVKAVNDAPVVEDLHLTLKKNSSVSVFYSGSDAEMNSLSFRVVDTPRSGELWTYPNVGTYYAKRGFFGTDVFHYVASDGKLESQPGKVTIEVINSNNPPTLVAQTFITKTNRPVRIAPSANDLDGDEVVFELVAEPKNGAVQVLEGQFIFTPGTDFLGTDAFSIRPFDGTAFGEPVVMSISVIATNVAPKAQNGSIIVAPNAESDIRLNGSDPDGDTISFTVLSEPLHGTITGKPPQLKYAPAPNYLGPDKITFKVSDGFAETEPATFTIQVVRQNRPPVGEDQQLTTGSGEPIAIALKVSDPDNDPLRTVILKGPAKGLLYGQGANFTYIPDIGAMGADSFTYKAWDGQKFGNSPRVTVVVSLPQSQLPPFFNSIELNGTTVQLFISTPNTNAFFIEASTNLLDWAVLAGPLLPVGDVFRFEHTNAAPSPTFYRARR